MQPLQSTSPGRRRLLRYLSAFSQFSVGSRVGWSESLGATGPQAISVDDVLSVVDFEPLAKAARNRWRAEVTLPLARSFGMGCDFWKEDQQRRQAVIDGLRGEIERARRSGKPKPRRRT